MTKERVTVAICLFLAWLRTGEAMVPYSPQSIFGLRSDWIEFLWAYVAAGAVEGVLWMAYTKLRDSVKDHNTKWAAAGVAILSIIFSGVMNVIDVRTQNGTLTLAAGSPEVDFLINVIVLIPLIVAVLFGIVEIVDAHFDDHGRGGHKQQNRPSQNNQPRPQIRDLGRPNERKIPPPPAETKAPLDEMGFWESEAGRHSNGHSKGEQREFTSEVTDSLTLAERKHGPNPTLPRSVTR